MARKGELHVDELAECAWQAALDSGADDLAKDAEEPAHFAYDSYAQTIAEEFARHWGGNAPLQLNIDKLADLLTFRIEQHHTTSPTYTR